MPRLTDTRASYAYLRSICRDVSERMILGDAIKNGWDAFSLTKLAESLRLGLGGRSIQPKEDAYRRAIYVGAAHDFDNTQPCQCWLIAAAFDTACSLSEN